MPFTIQVNNVQHDVDVDGDMPLLWVLRDVLGMTGTKFGCGMALCGACTVHVDGDADPLLHHARSTASATLAVTTIEAIGATPAGQKVQKAWLDLEVVQCGYCQSGQIMSAAALLASKPKPSDADIDAAMSGNICRCGTYLRIREAIKQAAQASGRSREADHDPRSLHTRRVGQTRKPQRRSLSRREFPAGRCRRRRRPAAQLQPAVRAAPERKRRQTRDFAPNAFIRIDRDGGSTLIMPQGRDGPGHLHVHADAARRGTRSRPVAGRRSSSAAGRRALRQSAARHSGHRRLDLDPRVLASRCARPAPPRARCSIAAAADAGTSIPPTCRARKRRA